MRPLTVVVWVAITFSVFDVDVEAANVCFIPFLHTGMAKHFDGEMRMAADIAAATLNFDAAAASFDEHKLQKDARVITADQLNASGKEMEEMSLTVVEAMARKFIACHNDGKKIIVIGHVNSGVLHTVYKTLVRVWEIERGAKRDTEVPAANAAAWQQRLSEIAADPSKRVTVHVVTCSPPNAESVAAFEAPFDPYYFLSVKPKPAYFEARKAEYAMWFYGPRGVEGFGGGVGGGGAVQTGTAAAPTPAAATSTHAVAAVAGGSTVTGADVKTGPAGTVAAPSKSPLQLNQVAAVRFPTGMIEGSVVNLLLVRNENVDAPRLFTYGMLPYDDVEVARGCMKAYTLKGAQTSTDLAFAQSACVIKAITDAEKKVAAGTATATSPLQPSRLMTLSEAFPDLVGCEKQLTAGTAGTAGAHSIPPALKMQLDKVLAPPKPGAPWKKKGEGTERISVPLPNVLMAVDTASGNPLKIRRVRRTADKNGKPSSRTVLAKVSQRVRVRA